MNKTIMIIILSQVPFSIGGLMARINMPKDGFSISTFLSSWFLIYFLIRIIAMFGQFYAFATIELGKTMALFGALSILTANLLGFLILQEMLNIGEYIGIMLVITAFIILYLT